MMLNKKLLQHAMLAAAAATIGSCSYNPNDYSGFAEIDADGWRADRTFVFMPEIQDSIARGTLSLFVRHTNDYPYSNLWVELESQQPADSGHIEVRRDTFSIELADIYGNWYGSGSGTSFQLKDTVITGFAMLNEAPLRLRHIMRPDPVDGLEQIGIIFEED